MKKDTNKKEEKTDYRGHLKEYIKKLRPFFARITVGDFSDAVKVPRATKGIKEIEELYSGIRVMNEVMLEKIKEHENTVSKLKRAQNKTDRLLEEVAQDKDELKNSEKRFRALVEHSPAGIIIIDKEGNISFAGPSTKSLLGYAPLEVAGRPIFDFLHKEDKAKAVKRLKHLLGKPGAHTKSEYRVLHKDGTFRRLEVTGTNLFHNNAIEGIVLNYRDITEEKDALRKVKDLASIVENSDDAILSKDLEGVITYWNEGAEELYGYKKEEIVGQKVHKIVPPKRKSEVKRFLDSIKNGEEIKHFETERLRKDGSRVYISLTISPMKDEGGNIVGASAIARDITEKKLSEKKEQFLTKATETLSSSLEYKKVLKDLANISVPLLGDWCVINIMNEEGMLERVVVAHKDKDKKELTKKIEKKYQPNPDIELGIYKVVHSGKGSLYKTITEEMVKKTTHNKEHENILKELGVASSMAVPLKSRGKVIGAVSFVRGKDSKPYTEDDLAFAEELGVRVGFAVDNAILYKEMEDANRMKDAFIASLAHELRNPLAPIVSSLELMRMEDIKNPEIAEAVDTIERHVKNTTHILDDLLDLSRVSRGVLKMHKDIIDAKEVANHAAETSLPFIKKGEHAFETQFTEEPIYINADAVRMEQILVNLLNNASKYTKSGGNIKLTCQKDGKYAEFKVKDNGKGIEPSFMPHIFDMFAQADKRLNRPTQGGLGVGLSLVKTLTAMHDGTISVHSEGVGRGTEFVVRIPIYEDNKNNSGKEKNKDKSNDKNNKTADDNRRGGDILIVDDNIDAAQSLAKLLKNSGFSVSTVHNGTDALASLDGNRPKTILLDIGLPKMDGYEVAKEIRARKKGNDIILIAVTGYGRDKDKEKAKKAGFDYHITKPVSMGELRDLLNKKH